MVAAAVVLCSGRQAPAKLLQYLPTDRRSLLIIFEAHTHDTLLYLHCILLLLLLHDNHHFLYNNYRDEEENQSVETHFSKVFVFEDMPPTDGIGSKRASYYPM